jgi:hypothetical protein
VHTHHVLAKGNFAFEQFPQTPVAATVCHLWPRGCFSRRTATGAFGRCATVSRRILPKSGDDRSCDVTIGSRGRGRNVDGGSLCAVAIVGGEEIECAGLEAGDILFRHVVSPQIVIGTTGWGGRDAA